MPRTVTVAAADLGASAGRIMTGCVGPGQLTLHEVHRFPNVPVTAGGTMHWDILAIYAGVLAGLRAASRGFDLASAGIDAWAVDYGLLDASGTLLGNPVHYRDARTEGVAGRVLATIPARELYNVTGVAQLPFNTLYQLVAAAGTPQLSLAATLLLIPDLLTFWLTGVPGAEVTNASTTQLYDVRSGSWARSLIERAGIPASIFPPLRQPGEQVGPLLPEAMAESGLGRPIPVIAVGSHDTASAVAAVPAAGPAFGYISCGTWSLAGLELDQPILSDASRQANFTNETGIDGTIRYLRNIMGLWLLQECQRHWVQAGQNASLDGLLAAAATAPSLRAVIDASDPAFLTPGSMPARIAAACTRTGQPPPENPPQTVRCILDSLAIAHQHSLQQAQALSGRHLDTVHMVGGGSRNELLCQLTADACGLPVVAGPAEAAAIGNILVQARTLGAAPAALDDLRALIRQTQPLRHYQPSGDQAVWQAAAARLGLA